MDKKMNVLDVRLDDYTAKDAMKAIAGYLQTDLVSTVKIVTADVLIQAAQTDRLKEDIEQLDLVLAGNKAILEAAEVMDKRRLEEAHNQTFQKMLFRYFHKNHFGLFVLADSEEELMWLKAYLEDNYAGIRIAGGEVVPGDESADDMIMNQINGAEVDCVLAGLISPKQEEFILRCREALNARLWLGIGREDLPQLGETGMKERMKELFERRILKRRVEKEKKKSHYS